MYNPETNVFITAVTIAYSPQYTIGNRLPVIVMELMGESLTRFLERSDAELPIYVQVNFCHDIALAPTCTPSTLHIETSPVTMFC